MELEFDKEMDAILRRARPIREPSVLADTAHPDADAIAAFAEGSLPDKARLAYIRHFADCDRCRRIMVFSMPEASSDVAVAAPAALPVVETMVPWYSRLFQTRNLAIAMGSLVLVLGVGLVFLIIDRGSNQNATVAQMDENERTAGNRPFDGQLPGGSAVTANANTATSAANAAPGSDTALPTADQLTNQVTRPGEPVLPKVAAPTDSGLTSPAPRPEADVTREEPSALASAPAPPPPAPMAMKKAAPPSDDRKDADNQVADVTVTSREQTESERKTESRFGRSRDLPPAASKSGPARSGPLNAQSQINQSNIIDMPVTRRVSGKSFNNRDGVWYDSAYHSQGTVNYRRGTPEYNKLDKGLRSIADTLGGTVVVVWKDKSYRIN